MTLLEWSSVNILMTKKLAKKFSNAESNEDFRIAAEELISFLDGFHLDIQVLNDDNTDLIIHNRVDRIGIYLKVDGREFTSTVIFLTEELQKLIKERFSKDLAEDRKMLEDIMEQLDQGIISYDDIVDAVETFEDFHGINQDYDDEDLYFCEIHGQYEPIEDSYENMDNSEFTYFDDFDELEDFLAAYNAVGGAHFEDEDLEEDDDYENNENYEDDDNYEEDDDEDYDGLGGFDSDEDYDDIDLDDDFFY